MAEQHDDTAEEREDPARVQEEIEPHSAGGAVHVRLDPDAPGGPAARVEVHPAGPAERPARAPLVLLVLPLGVPVV